MFTFWCHWPLKRLDDLFRLYRTGQRCGGPKVIPNVFSVCFVEDLKITTAWTLWVYFFWNKFPDAKEADSADGCDSGVVNAMSGVELVSTLFDGTKTYHQLDHNIHQQVSQNQIVSRRKRHAFHVQYMINFIKFDVFFMNDQFNNQKIIIIHWKICFSSQEKIKRTNHPPQQKYIIHFFGGPLESTTP